jgi:hypothetical protein
MALDTKTKKTEKTNGQVNGKPTSSLFDAFEASSGKKLEVVDPNGKVIHPEWMPDMR